MTINYEVGVYYAVYKKILMAAPREMLVVVKTYEQDGNWIDVSTSVELDDFPVEKDRVRVQVHYGGHFIQPILPDEQGNITQILAFSHADFQIPAALKGASLKFAANAIPRHTKNLLRALDLYIHGNPNRQRKFCLIGVSGILHC